MCYRGSKPLPRLGLPYPAPTRPCRFHPLAWSKVRIVLHDPDERQRLTVRRPPGLMFTIPSNVSRDTASCPLLHPYVGPSVVQDRESEARAIGGERGTGIARDPRQAPSGGSISRAVPSLSTPYGSNGCSTCGTCAVYERTVCDTANWEAPPPNTASEGATSPERPSPGATRHRMARPSAPRHHVRRAGAP